jgi:hypothetical protein
MEGEVGAVEGKEAEGQEGGPGEGVSEWRQVERGRMWCLVRLRQRKRGLGVGNLHWYLYEPKRSGNGLWPGLSYIKEGMPSNWPAYKNGGIFGGGPLIWPTSVNRF